ncbi:MAG: permease-like cell division protein FtsX [Paenibacillus macerans]|uniref:permease-like cell division protein FtsX n=1 Tax=Paenibacillus macerans TaxID=44252 RepID=UPI000EE02EAE|nr:permease-like cell division protein FtsX [Paenibacillus macerans]MDU7474358.1 permease-like cell division protein FtsX [Paenibacillus macerans]GBK65145.1 ABC transporter permease [Paenibacillus macerans]GBK71477.1 ABC transporter permease [Paenibacillus macerans]
MTISTFFRHLREGAKNVFRNGWMSVASITSIIVSLLILGVFILLVLNVNSFADEADSQVQIKAYLNSNVTEAVRNQLSNEIGSMAEVSRVTLIPKAQGLKDFREKLGEQGKDLLEGYDEKTNPIPDTFQVEVVEPTTIPFVASKIQALNDKYDGDPVYKVNYGQGTVEKLFKITRLIRNIGFAFVAGLGLMAMFLISNTIRVTILARRREIGIMKLVGATNRFIRGPFFVEGALIGLIGSLITVAILYISYDQLVQSVKADITLAFRLVPVSEIGLELGGLLVGLGLLIGIWGSTMSIRKFLKV